MDKPTRCIDPVMKFCQECRWGWVHYPEWVETAEDLEWCSFESGCTLGFEHDEPTEEDLKEFERRFPINGETEKNQVHRK